MNKILSYLLLLLLIIQYCCTDTCNSKKEDANFESQEACSELDLELDIPSKCVLKTDGGCEEKAIKCNEVIDNTIKSTNNCEAFELGDDSTDSKCTSKESGGCEERKLCGKETPSSNKPCSYFPASDSNHECVNDGDTACKDEFKKCNDKGDDTSLKVDNDCSVFRLTFDKPSKCVAKAITGGCEEKAIKCNEVIDNTIKSTNNCEAFELELSDSKCIDKQGGGCEEQKKCGKGAKSTGKPCSYFLVSDTNHKCVDNGESDCKEEEKTCNDLVKIHL